MIDQTLLAAYLVFHSDITINMYTILKQQLMTNYFIEILHKCQGYLHLINSLNIIAQAKDESIITCKEWNDFVEWVMLIGVKYVCFLSYRTVCNCCHIFGFGIRVAFFLLLVFCIFCFCCRMDHRQNRIQL